MMDTCALIPKLPLHACWIRCTCVCWITLSEHGCLKLALCQAQVCGVSEEGFIMASFSLKEMS